MSRDLIDRQTVINALDHVISHGAKSNVGECHFLSAEGVKEYVLSLPSTQPEIIRCKNCKHSHLTYDGKNKYCVHWPNNTFSPTEYIDGDFYCGFAKRREE